MINVTLFISEEILLFSTLIPINPNAGVTMMEDLFSFKVCFVHFKKLQRKMISDC